MCLGWEGCKQRARSARCPQQGGFEALGPRCGLQGCSAGEQTAPLGAWWLFVLGFPPLRAGFAHFGAALLSSFLRLSSKKQTVGAIPACLQTTPPQAPNPVTSPHSPRHRLQQGRCPGPGSPWCCRRAQPGAAAALSSAARPRSAADLQLVFSLIYVTAYLCPLLKTIPFVSAVNETVYHPAAAGPPPEMSFAPVLSRQKSF